jgi:hypothetical protein
VWSALAMAECRTVAGAAGTAVNSPVKSHLRGQRILSWKREVSTPLLANCWARCYPSAACTCGQAIFVVRLGEDGTGPQQSSLLGSVRIRRTLICEWNGRV